MWYSSRALRTLRPFARPLRRAFLFLADSVSASGSIPPQMAPGLLRRFHRRLLLLTFRNGARSGRAPLRVCRCPCCFCFGFCFWGCCFGTCCCGSCFCCWCSTCFCCFPVVAAQTLGLLRGFAFAAFGAARDFRLWEPEWALFPQANVIFLLTWWRHAVTLRAHGTASGLSRLPKSIQTESRVAEVLHSPMHEPLAPATFPRPAP